MTRAGAIAAVVTAWATAWALAGLAACKDRRAPVQQDPPVAVADAAVADANLDACRAAAARAAGLPRARRPQVLLDGCRPCGDWQPLLDWNTPVTSGGPSRAAIERAMVACRAFCEPNAKQRFLGTLDAARGQDARGPWRYLGEICKAEVSAAPDTRFMGAPYFALDRIARALGGLRDPAVAAIDVPLPALSITGVGVELPRMPYIGVDAGPAALTVYVTQVLIGTLPTATLSATGLAVSGDYPGTPIDEPRLAAALAAPALAGQPIAVLAPRSLPAARIAQVVAAAGDHELRLAIAIPGPGGWAIPTTLPVALSVRPARGPRLAVHGGGDHAAIDAARADLARDPPTLAIEATDTVDELAGLLQTLAAAGVKTAALAAPNPAPPGKP